MAGSSLLTLIDDIASLLDDVSLMSKMAAKKTAGVLGDDLALNAQQVTGVKADRELPVVWAVARGSLVNKAILVPAALAISAVAPWLITPLLMVGGAYLCFEGFEKLAHKALHSPAEDAVARAALVKALTDPQVDLLAFERDKIKAAVRTDFILSAEIMAIALADVATKSLWEQGAVLAVVGIFVTVGVYGLVGAIVKMDDVGLHLAKGSTGIGRSIGRGLVSGMPGLLKALGVIGTAAMLWVGGQIIIHGLKVLGWGAPEHLIHNAAIAVGHGVPGIGGLIEWIVNAAASGVFGLIVGAVIIGVMHFIPKRATGA